MAIPILNLKPEVEEFWEELNPRSSRSVFKVRAQFIMGPNVKAFEAKPPLISSQTFDSSKFRNRFLIIRLRPAGLGGGRGDPTPFTFLRHRRVRKPGWRHSGVRGYQPSDFTIDPDLIEQTIPEDQGDHSGSFMMDRQRRWIDFILG